MTSTCPKIDFVHIFPICCISRRSYAQSHPAFHSDHNTQSVLIMTDLEKTPSLRVSSHRTPFSWLTPTHLAFDPNTSTSPTGSTWQSRRARKGRYTAKDTHVTYAHPHQSDGAKKVVMKARIAHPGVKLKPGLWFDISWWLAFTFTLGSAIWVVNGQYSHRSSFHTKSSKDTNLSRGD